MKILLENKTKIIKTNQDSYEIDVVYRCTICKELEKQHWSCRNERIMKDLMFFFARGGYYPLSKVYGQIFFKNVKEMLKAC